MRLLKLLPLRALIVFILGGPTLSLVDAKKKKDKDKDKDKDKPAPELPTLGTCFSDAACQTYNHNITGDHKGSTYFDGVCVSFKAVAGPVAAICKNCHQCPCSNCRPVHVDECYPGYTRWCGD